MNSKAEQTRSLSVADISKLVLALAVLAFTMWAFYHYSEVATSLRAVGVMAGVAISLAIAAFTSPGAKAREFMGEAQFEMRKVVWPTREETVRTTIMIIIVTIVLALVLGLIDILLNWAIFETLLNIGS